MKEQFLLKIGEFARVAQVSIATLRYYDRCGLLKPVWLDGETGYRYYALDQLPRLYRILALKDLGLPLEQIALLLKESLSLEQLRSMFALKQEETRQLIESEQRRLVHIAARIRQLEQEEALPTYEVLMKQVEPLLMATIRETGPLPIWNEEAMQGIAAYLEQQGMQPGEPQIFLLYSRSEQREDGLYMDREAAIPLLQPLPGNERITVRTLPGGPVAATIYRGPDLLLGQAYAALYRWMQEGDHRLAGPPRLLSLRRGVPHEPDASITEIQFPLAR
jgi:DNA-binding transcriptional MerR regulator